MGQVNTLHVSVSWIKPQHLYPRSRNDLMYRCSVLLFLPYRPSLLMCLWRPQSTFTQGGMPGNNTHLALLEGTMSSVPDYSCVSWREATDLYEFPGQKTGGYRWKQIDSFFVFKINMIYFYSTWKYIFSILNMPYMNIFK